MRKRHRKFLGYVASWLLVLVGNSIAPVGAGGGANLADMQSFHDVLEGGTDGPEMVLIAPGKFLLGSWKGDPERDEDENPRVRIELKQAFYIARYEASVAEFGRFIEDSGYETDGETTGCAIWEDGRLKMSNESSWRNLPGFATGPNHPVVCVSWRDAVTYTDWLSVKTGSIYRLPTEAEWEYSARADTATARFWGQDPDAACDFANVADQSHRARYPLADRQIHHCDDGYAQAAPVGSHRANNFGLYDVLGNVWEWTCTAYVEKYASTAQPCSERKNRDARVLRGGAWYVSPRSVRSAHRNAGAIFSQAASVGFRVVREL
jgi:formylglycine-generating enzyme required for sulfatase activity